MSGYYYKIVEGKRTWFDKNNELVVHNEHNKHEVEGFDIIDCELSWIYLTEKAKYVCENEDFLWRSDGHLDNATEAWEILNTKVPQPFFVSVYDSESDGYIKGKAETYLDIYKFFGSRPRIVIGEGEPVISRAEVEFFNEDSKYYRGMRIIYLYKSFFGVDYESLDECVECLSYHFPR